MNRLEYYVSHVDQAKGFNVVGLAISDFNMFVDLAKADAEFLDSVRYCPVCLKHNSEGHGEGCALAPLLEQVEGR